MVTKGIITSIDFNGNTCKVRIPLFETAGNDPIIHDAIISNTPGMYNGYKVSDVVLVAFEDGQMELPVVVGKLYLGAEKEKQDPRGSLNTETLTATKTASVPSDTKLTFDTDKNLPNTMNPYASISSVANNLNKLNTDVTYLDAFTENQFRSIITDADGLRSAIEQNARAIELKVDEESDGVETGLSWTLTKDEWKLTRHNPDLSGGKKDILIADENNFTINAIINAEKGGTIGGFDIGTDSLTAGTGTNAVGISTDSTNKKAFWAGNTASGNAPFYVTHDGKLHSIDGDIGGFTIGTNSLHTQGKPTLDTDAAGVYVGNEGIALGTTDNFRVTAGGDLLAKRGVLGPWVFDPDILSNDWFELAENGIKFKGADTTRSLIAEGKLRISDESNISGFLIDSQSSSFTPITLSASVALTNRTGDTWTIKIVASPKPSKEIKNLTIYTEGYDYEWVRRSIQFNYPADTSSITFTFSGYYAGRAFVNNPASISWNYVNWVTQGSPDGSYGDSVALKYNQSDGAVGKTTSYGHLYPSGATNNLGGANNAWNILYVKEVITSNLVCATINGTAVTELGANSAGSTPESGSSGGGSSSGGSSGGGGGCFDAGSQVLMADGTTKNIEDIQAGDLVMSFNVKSGTIEQKNVIETYKFNQYLNLVTLQFADGTVIHTTIIHPFYTTIGWVSLQPNYNYNMDHEDLANQDLSLMSVGQKFIKVINNTIEQCELIGIKYRHGIEESHNVYNLDIDDYNTFIVNGMVVHNQHVKLSD